MGRNLQCERKDNFEAYTRAQDNSGERFRSQIQLEVRCVRMNGGETCRSDRPVSVTGFVVLRLRNAPPRLWSQRVNERVLRHVISKVVAATTGKKARLPR